MGASPRTDLAAPEKELVDAYMNCAEAAWKSLVDRRIYEWKISFGLWAGLGAFAGFIQARLQQPQQLLPQFDSGPMKVVSVLLVIIGLVYTFWWIPEYRKRDSDDHATAAYFWDKVEDCLGVSSRRKMRSAGFVKEREQYWRFKPYSHWASGSQVVITWALVLVALISVLPKPTACVWGLIGFGVVVIFLSCILLDYTWKAKPDPIPGAADSKTGRWDTEGS